MESGFISLSYFDCVERLVSEFRDVFTNLKQINEYVPIFYDERGAKNRKK
jgi:hypothetical protein